MSNTTHIYNKKQIILMGCAFMVIDEFTLTDHVARLCCLIFEDQGSDTSISSIQCLLFQVILIVPSNFRNFFEFEKLRT